MSGALPGPRPFAGYQSHVLRGRWGFRHSTAWEKQFYIYFLVYFDIYGNVIVAKGVRASIRLVEENVLVNTPL